MSTVAELDKKLNEAILTGRAMEAFEELYADDVVMMENNETFVGKELNRKREIEFFSSVAEWHGAKVEFEAINGDVTFGQWWMDVTFKNGYRYTNTQIAVRQWKDGKLVHERFFYNKG